MAASPQARLTQAELKAALDYDPETGGFVWKWREGTWKGVNKRYAGKPAGHVNRVNKNRYIQIGLNGVSYYAHRLAWLYMTGELPEAEVDHIDGDGRNNRIGNLRSVTIRENTVNMPLRSDSTTGATGVCWDKMYQKYLVRVSHNGKPVHGGHFVAFEDAVARAQAMRREFGYHPNHGLTREQRAATSQVPGQPA